MPTPSPRTTPRAKSRKIIKRENQNLPSREVAVKEKTKTISTLKVVQSRILTSLTGQINFTDTATVLLK